MGKVKFAHVKSHSTLACRKTYEQLPSIAKENHLNLDLTNCMYCSI